MLWRLGEMEKIQLASNLYRINKIKCLGVWKKINRHSTTIIFFCRQSTMKIMPVILLYYAWNVENISISTRLPTIFLAAYTFIWCLSWVMHVTSEKIEYACMRLSYFFSIAKASSLNVAEDLKNIQWGRTRVPQGSQFWNNLLHD